MNAQISGIEPGQRQLNGPQTTGRDYANLSVPEHEMVCDQNVAVKMRDGVELLVDVHRPVIAGRYPVLVAASAYPRQIQNSGAPLGFIEAGQSDFFVPRGYVHVIANVRGTGGSGGTFGFFDGQERRDMHDLVEWAGEQQWSDGKVGMVGISYFAMTQLEAAVEQPSHLEAIFPVAASIDLFEAGAHNGLMSSSFVTSFLAMVGMTSSHGDKVWRSKLVDAASHVLHNPRLHKKFETANGEAAMAGLNVLLKLPHDPDPWDDLWRAIAAEHPVRDDWWDDRNLLPLLHKVNVPVYLGCDWQNVSLHLPATFQAFPALTNSPHVQMGMLGEHGLSWPWESLHIEALAWFDHWLKGRDTGILDGPKVRYVVPEADGWRTAASWPLPDERHRELSLRADGGLDEDEGEAGVRPYLTLGSGLKRTKTSAADPPPMLTWDTEPLDRDLDMVGEIELQLDATSTALDTAWIVTLQDVDESAQATDVTAGYLRASLRELDEKTSRPGAPTLTCRHPEAVPIGAAVRYRVPLVPNARRFHAGHRIRVVLTSDDQNPTTPAVLGFRHASVGTSTLNTIASSSRLLLPVAPAATDHSDRS
jgi:uncharacterized protein